MPVALFLRAYSYFVCTFLLNWGSLGLKSQGIVQIQGIIVCDDTFDGHGHGYHTMDAILWTGGMFGKIPICVQRRAGEAGRSDQHED